MPLSQIPAAVAAQLAELGAKINTSECVEFRGYWAVDFVLSGTRSRVSFADGQLAVERPMPIMQSGHQADWYVVKTDKVMLSNAVTSKAVELAQTCQSSST